MEHYESSDMTFGTINRKELGAHKYARKHKNDANPARVPLRLQTFSEEDMLKHAAAIAPQPLSADKISSGQKERGKKQRRKNESSFDPHKTSHFQFTGRLATDAVQVEVLFAAGRSSLGIACMLHEERPEMSPKEVVRYLQKMERRRGPKTAFADTIAEELFRREYYVDYSYVH